jgi:DNA-binding transcriptional ArsR family regulator
MAIRESTSDPLSAVFSALGNPTRRAILERLARGEASVMELSKPFGVSQPTISKHLKVLEDAGLIDGIRDAQRRPRRLRLSAIKSVDEWIEPYRQLWERRLDNLDRHLAARKSKKET